MRQSWLLHFLCSIHPSPVGEASKRYRSNLQLHSLFSPICKTALLICFRKTAGRLPSEIWLLLYLPVFLTLLPQARTAESRPGQRLKLCLAAHHGNSTPPRISPSCPFQDRSTNAGAVIARQIGHDLLSGRSDPLPTLLAAFMQIVCTGGSSRSLQCRCPFSIFTRHTNGCISVSGYALGKVHEKAFFGFRKSSPHYLSSFRGILIADSEKLPKTF